MTKTMIRILSSAFFATSIGSEISAFRPPYVHKPASSRNQKTRLSKSFTDAEEYIAKNYPSCSVLFARGKDVMKQLNKSEEGFTIFAPNEAAFSSLGNKKQSQLEDVRNGELTEKIVAYHCIAEPVTADQLFNAVGVITMGGEVPVVRSTSGGFFGVLGKEDGGVTLTGAKIVKSIDFSDDDSSKTFVVHEVDNLVSPNILWRYADQLRIPGSK